MLENFRHLEYNVYRFINFVKNDLKLLYLTQEEAIPMRKKIFHLILISVMAGTMLVGCANENTSSDQPSENVSAATTENSSQLTEGESTSSESTESVSEETSSNVTESVSTESEVVEDNNSEEIKEEFTESATTKTEETTTEEVTEEIVASGFLEDADIEWKIVGTTLYVSGVGEIPNLPESPDDFKNWQIYGDMIEKVIIEDGITKIGNWNFSHFRKMKEVIFADSVNEIGRGSFYYTGLETLNLNKVTKLGHGSFGRSDFLTTVTIPGTIKNVPSACFSSAYGLREIFIEEGVESLSNTSFFIDSKDIIIHLPASLASIHENAWAFDLTVYVKAGSYAEQYVNENAQRDHLTIIVE